MARMRVIGSSFDKGYRDDLNYNFGLLEALISEANELTNSLRQEMLNQINNLQRQIDLLAGENIDELLAKLDDSIRQALTLAQDARTAKTATEEATALATVATEIANASALLAEEKANYANEKAVLAQEAAENANQEAFNLSQLKIDVVQATQDANVGAENANDKAILAKNAADRANLAAENADTATSIANLAAEVIKGWGTAEQWVSDKQYIKNNVVTNNGSTWQALRPNIGVTPVEGLDWTCLARKGLDGNGAVSSVNNRLPDTNGNVEIEWNDVPEKPATFPPSTHTHEISSVNGLQFTLDGKADSGELTLLEQRVSKHIDDTSAHISEYENSYWLDKWALLDPKCLELFYGKTFSFIVPEGEYRYLIASWANELVEEGTRMEVRNIFKPLLLPARTLVKTNGVSVGSHVFIINPFKVTPPSNPKQAYYQRLDRLKKLSLHSLKVNTNGNEQMLAHFPSDFENGLAVEFNSFDVSWNGLTDINNFTMNTANEISDDGQWRASNQVLLPFKRSFTPAFKSRGVTGLQGTASMAYYKLPPDW